MRCKIQSAREFLDAYGHKEGDYAIIASTQCIKESVRKTDLLRRSGGNGF